METVYKRLEVLHPQNMKENDWPHKANGLHRIKIICDEEFATCLSQMPPSNTTGYVDPVYEVLTTEGGKSSSSCPELINGHQGGRQRQEAPPFMNDQEARSWAKERQKKDNHNQSKWICFIPEM